ncbi:PH domain-containing protein [Candidatus Marsarchaeota archaeon]|nr:PH domain-containing protein [Candidatus Marsarchaeota archaeon]
MADLDDKFVKKEHSIPLELRDGEVIKKEIRPNMSKYLFRQAVKGVVLFLVIYVVLIAVFVFLLAYKVNKGGAAALYISSVILLAYMAISMISYPRKLYWITTQRIIESGGVISNQLNFIPLESVSYIEPATNFLDRMTGLCHMKVNRDWKSGFLDANASPVGKTGKDIIQFVESSESSNMELLLQGLVELRRTSISKSQMQKK